MSVGFERRRVLIATGPDPGTCLREGLGPELDPCWEILEADSFERARFILQHAPCDVLVVDEGLAGREGVAGLGWLAGPGYTPVVLLSSPEPSVIRQAFREGASLWLPRELALAEPALLAAALDQACRLADLARGKERALEQLSQCRRQVDRLLGSLWRVSPAEGNDRWLPQRHLMERLHEEVSRSARHGVPLTVVLGEVSGAGEDFGLGDVVAQAVGRVKRRCDLAGPYGAGGFLMLLVQTPREGGVSCCRRLKKILEQFPGSGPHPPKPLHTFFGLACTSDGPLTCPGLLRRAEEDLEANRKRAAATLLAN